MLGIEHLHLAHVFGAGALGDHEDVEVRAFGVKVEVGHGQAGAHGGLGVNASDVVGGAAAEGEFHRGTLGAFVEGGLDLRAVPRVVRTDLHLVDGQAGVLTEQGLFGVRDLDGLEHGLEDAAGCGLRLSGVGFFQGFAHVRGQVAQRLDVKLLGRFFYNGVIKGFHTSSPYKPDAVGAEVEACGARLVSRISDTGFSMGSASRKSSASRKDERAFNCSGVRS